MRMHRVLAALLRAGRSPGSDAGGPSLYDCIRQVIKLASRVSTKNIWDCLAGTDLYADVDFHRAAVSSCPPDI